MVLLLAIFALLAAYVILLLSYCIVWWTWPRKVKSRGHDQPFISVIVPLRNEEERVDHVLRSLLCQTYPNFELIAVNDHSDDGTRGILEGYDGEVSILDLPVGTEGKKAALSYGVECASGDFICTTDADCVMTDAWLDTMVKTLVEDNCDAVTGPVHLTGWQGFAGAFQALDLAGLAVISGSGLRLGLHTLANGANLLFRKSAFEALRGYSENLSIASGDDLFLVQGIAKQLGGTISFCRDKCAIVRTAPCHSWTQFVNQRVRWGSKNRYLPEYRVHAIWGFVWVVNAISFVLVVGAIAGMVDPLATAVFAGLKFTVESLLIVTGLRFTNQLSAALWLPFALPVNILYVCFAGLLALLKPSYSWKDRRVSTV